MRQPATSDRFSLDQLRIAAPCDAKWEDMTGDERVRHCGQCGLNVYDLSELSRDDAETLVREHTLSGKRLCARLYKRADGTVITRDCPRGLAALKARARRGWQRAVASIALLTATSTLLAVVNSRGKREAGGLSDLQTFSAVKSAVNPAPPPPPVVAIRMGSCIMGKIALPSPPAIAGQTNAIGN